VWVFVLVVVVETAVGDPSPKSHTTLVMRLAATVTPLSFAETEHVVDPGLVTVPQFTVMSGTTGAGAAVTVTVVVADAVGLPPAPVTLTLAVNVPAVV